MGYHFPFWFLNLHSLLECRIRTPISDQSSVLIIRNLIIIFLDSSFEDISLFCPQIQKDNRKINSAATFDRDNSTVKLVESGYWVLC